MNREQISALMDGELDEARAQSLCAQLKSEESVECWAAYHLIGDALRNDCLAQQGFARRFAERLADPLKRWKLSPIDLQAREKYAGYSRARDRMLQATHTKHAPWALVDFNDQRRGRLKLIRHLLDGIPDRKVPEQLIEFPPLAAKPLRDQPASPFEPI